MGHPSAYGVLRHVCLPAILLLLTLSVRAQQTTTYTYQYDPNGNLTQSTDPLGRITRHSYDALNRRITTTDPAGGITSFSYDARDHLTAVTDPRGLVTAYTYDGFGNLTSTTSPDTGTTTHTYDAGGNRTSSTDARGQTTAYAYDVLHRLTKITYADASTVAYSYDQGAYAIGRLSGMADGSGQTSYSYDARGRITATVHTIGSGTATRSYTVSRTYGSSGSATGKPVQLTYPSGNRIEMAYDAGGRLASLNLYAVTASTTAVPLLTNITHAPFGPATGWHWGNGAVPYQRSSDLDGRWTGYPLGHGTANGSIRTLGYDAASRLIAVTDSASAAASASYGYDSLDRLTSAVTGSNEQGYQYDATGNRTQWQIGSASYANTIASSSNRLLATTGQAPAKSNSYDAAGNLITDGSIGYTYAASGRMQSATIGSSTVSYRYNGLGQRVRKSGPTSLVPSREVDYVYDEAGQLLGEYDASGKPLQETVYLGHVPVAVIKPVNTGIGTRKTQSYTMQVYYIYADQTDTPRMITRATDNRIVWRWDQADPFGVQGPDENPGGLGTFVYNLRFPGQVYDRETNLHYNYLRDGYDPAIGGYTQPDPIGNVLYRDMAGHNLFSTRGRINADLAEQLYSENPVYNHSYNYVGGKPLRYKDPKGLVAVVDDIVIGGSVIIVGCALSPGCRQAISDVAQACGNLIFNRPKNPPDVGPPGGWIQGPRRGRQYGPDGRPQYDIDKPHQGNEQDHVHEWPNGVREEPGRPVTPLPERK